MSARSGILIGTQTQALRRTLVEAAVVALAGVLIALLFNALRPAGLALVAHTP